MHVRTCVCVCVFAFLQKAKKKQSVCFRNLKNTAFKQYGEKIDEALDEEIQKVHEIDEIDEIDEEEEEIRGGPMEPRRRNERPFGGRAWEWWV